ncbi:MAG: transposase [Ideonella sp.]|nr:transposase [Ideonella sp.]
MSTKPSDQAFDKRRTRRTYSAAFKAKAVTASLRPGNSLAGVAHANGIHITLLRRWVRESQMRAGIDLQRLTPSSGLRRPSSRWNCPPSALGRTSVSSCDAGRP